MKYYDLIIWGNSPAAIHEAVSAAETGRKVLIAAPDAYTGGPITSSLCLIQKNPSESLSVVLERDLSLRPAVSIDDHFSLWDPEEIKFKYHRYLIDSKADILFYIKPFELYLKTGEPHLLRVMAREGVQEFRAEDMIDYSSNGELFRLSGHPLDFGGTVLNFIAERKDISVESLPDSYRINWWNGPISGQMYLRAEVRGHSTASEQMEFNEQMVAFQNWAGPAGLQILVYPFRPQLAFCEADVHLQHNNAVTWRGMDSRTGLSGTDLMKKCEEVLEKYGRL